MRHRNKGRQLGRTSTHKKAMLKNMVTSLMRHERIVTTVAKAKELRGVADRVITYAKHAAAALAAATGDAKKAAGLHQRRLAARYVNDADVLHTVFADYAQRYDQRPGGYTRIMRIGWRRGDAAEMAIIELMPAGEVGTAERRRRTTIAKPESGPVTTKESFADEKSK